MFDIVIRKATGGYQVTDYCENSMSNEYLVFFNKEDIVKWFEQRLDNEQVREETLHSVKT